MSNRLLQSLLALSLLFSLTDNSIATPVTTPSPTTDAQTAAASAQDNPALAKRLAALEQAVEARRQALGIPGLSLAIVQNDQIIFMKGFGVKDVDQQLPVTPDTLFAIGSATKAFTALLGVMSVDDGKLSLDDSPKKYLPYFKLSDPDADAQITLRDLLSNRSGLNRTDLAMATNTLTRAELIQIAGQAKPLAKLREKFLYQNIMFTAAGEAIANAQGKSWDTLITERIFKPLGMNATTLSVKEMQQAKDYSLGYNYDAATKKHNLLKTLDLAAVAPCGAINSNARDMTKWLRLLLNSGSFEGRRLVSEQNFPEIWTNHIAVGPNLNYGLGWFLRKWQEHKTIEHGGNIDGFNAMVALMPDQKLGMVMLSNVSASPLGNEIPEIVWSNLLNELPETTPANNSSETVAASNEAGSYQLAAAGINFEVKYKDGQLTLIAPGQPEHKLEHITGRRYKLADPAPAGFFVTFRPKKGNEKETELYLEQPHGNVVLARVDNAPVKLSPEVERAMKELLGSYEHDKSGKPLDISLQDNRVCLIAPNQPPFPLLPKEHDIFALSGLPEGFTITTQRDANGKVTGFILKQPNLERTFRRLAQVNITITADELIAKMITAIGGAENLRKHNSLVIKAKSEMLHQGLSGENTIYSKAPNWLASDTRLKALGKEIGNIAEYFDGTTGWIVASFGTPSEKTGKQLAELQANADFYQMLNWRKLYKSIEIKRLTKIGDEEAYVLVRTPHQGHTITDYVSTKTFLILKRDSMISFGSDFTLPATENFSDYRAVDGILMPFKIVSNNSEEGETITTLIEAKFDVNIPDATFKRK